MGIKLSARIRFRLTIGVLLIAVVVLLSSCVPVSTPAQVTITLSEAIALSKSNNIQQIVIDPNNGVLNITAAVSGPALQLTDINSNPIQIGNSELLVVNIGNLSLNDLQQLGLVLPPNYSTLPISSSNVGSSLIIGCLCCCWAF